MTSPADAMIDALRSNHDELVALVADLDHDALTGPSADTRVGHLAGAEPPRAAAPRSASAACAARWTRRSRQCPERRDLGPLERHEPEDRLTGFLARTRRWSRPTRRLDDATPQRPADRPGLPAGAGRPRAAGAVPAERGVPALVGRARRPSTRRPPSPRPRPRSCSTRWSFMLGWIGHADAIDGPVTLAVDHQRPGPVVRPEHRRRGHRRRRARRRGRHPDAAGRGLVPARHRSARARAHAGERSASSSADGQPRRPPPGVPRLLIGAL